MSYMTTRGARVDANSMRGQLLKTAALIPIRLVYNRVSHHHIDDRATHSHPIEYRNGLPQMNMGSQDTLERPRHWAFEFGGCLLQVVDALQVR